MIRPWHLMMVFVWALGASSLAQEVAPPDAPPASEPAKEAEADAAPAPAEPKQDSPQTSGQRTDLSRFSRSRGSGSSPTAAPAPALPERGRDPQWDQYRIIVDRNIFSRQRGAAVRGPDGEIIENGPAQVAAPAAPPGPPPDPATQVVLIGVSLVGDYATAIFEDRNAGSIIAVQIGEQLMDRVAREITLDGVTFDFKDGSVDVPIGRTLLGGEPLPADPSATTATSGESSATSGAGAPVSADQKAILERMLQRRREQEQNR